MSKNSSENEDDPAVYESSGSEWDSEDDLKPVRRPRRGRGAAKKGRAKQDTESDSIDEEEEEEEDVEPKAKKKKNGVSQKQASVSSNSSTPEPAKISKTINSKDFSTGSFLISKKDAQVGDPKKLPCIWRVDGKALLQKYEPFEDDDGKIKHKTTSIYTGWSALDRDLYAPVTVSVKQHNNQTLIVELNWDKLKEMNTLDSE